MKKLVVLIIGLLLFFPSIVQAGVTVDPSIDQDPGSPGGSCPSCAYVYSESYPYGAIVSIVDQNGNNLATSSGSASASLRYVDQLSGTVYGAAGAVNKKTAVAQAFSHISRITGSDTNAANFGFANPITSSNYKAEVYRLIGAGATINEQTLDNFLKLFGLNLSILKAACVNSEIFIEVQPMMSIKKVGSSTFVLGSITEIIKYLDEVDPSRKSFGRNTRCTFASYVTTPSTMGNVAGVSGCTNYVNAYGTSGSRVYGYAVGMFSLNNLLSTVCKKSGDTCASDKAKGLSQEELCSKYPGDTNCCPNIVTSSCDYYINSSSSVDEAKSMISTSCSVSNSGVVKDVASWDCIFKSESSTKLTDQSHYYLEEFGDNPYCAVYCTETLEYNFPKVGTKVDAGSWYILGGYSGTQINGPITYKGTSTCRVTSARGSTTGVINVTQFQKDWDAADKAVVVAWDAYQKELIEEHLHATTESTSDTSACCSGCCGSCPTGPDADTSCCGDSREDCTRYTYDSDYYLTSTWYSTFGTTSNMSSSNVRIKPSTWTDCCGNRDPNNYDISGKYAQYKSALNKRNKLLSYLKQCNNFARTYTEFNPSSSLGDAVTYKYDEKNYVSSYNLKKSVSIISSTDYYSGGNANTGGKVGVIEKNWSISTSNTSKLINNSINVSDALNNSLTNGHSSTLQHYECYGGRGSNCTGEYSSASYPTNVWLEQKTVKTITYTLPSGVYYYVDKASGESLNSATVNYRYLGFSNLPIHYSTKPGNYPIHVIYNSFGPNNKFNRYIVGSTNFTNNPTTNYSKDVQYSCTYTVNAEPSIICVEGSSDTACSDDKGGTDLIYRKVSLYYPFPGQNATENNLRDSGENWESNSNYYINSFIYNNRGVSYYEVYKIDPMYEIDLTPAVMRKIKKYNTQQESAVGYYYGATNGTSLGYSDFTLVCSQISDEGNASKCKSTFLRDYLNGLVTGCGIKNSGNYSNCGNTEAW